MPTTARLNPMIETLKSIIATGKTLAEAKLQYKDHVSRLDRLSPDDKTKNYELIDSILVGISGELEMPKTSNPVPTPK